MTTNHRCRWVRPRLPLLAGGELDVDDRREVERHLIVCPGCRDRNAASALALEALRASADADGASAPSRPPGGPSVWPALADQIRRSRHAGPRPWYRPRLRFRLPAPPWRLSTRPALGLTLGGFAAALVLLALPAGDRARPPSPIVGPGPAPSRVEAPAPPRVAAVASAPKSKVVAEPPRSASPPRPILPPSPIRVGYDLDHGTPALPGNTVPQSSY